MKNILKSKTFWFNALTLTAQASGLLASAGVSPSTALMVSNGANIALRMVTNTGVTLSPSTNVFMFLLLFLFIPTSVSAQSRTALWDMLDVPTVSYAQTLTYKLYVTPSGGNTSTVTLTGVTCAGTAPVANCQAPLPTSVTTPIGTKAELTATDTATGVESPRSIPFIKPVGAPSNFRLTLLEMLKSLTRHGKDSLATLLH